MHIRNLVQIAISLPACNNRKRRGCVSNLKSITENLGILVCGDGYTMSSADILMTSVASSAPHSAVPPDPHSPPHCKVGSHHPPPSVPPRPGPDRRNCWRRNCPAANAPVGPRRERFRTSTHPRLRTCMLEAPAAPSLQPSTSSTGSTSSTSCPSNTSSTSTTCATSSSTSRSTSISSTGPSSTRPLSSECLRKFALYFVVSRHNIHTPTRKLSLQSSALLGSHPPHWREDALTLRECSVSGHKAREAP